MSTNLIKTSFASGELAPSILAHTDLSQYKSGATLVRNFFVDYRSGASSRPGTKFIIQALLGQTAVRLIPFQFSTSVSYIIEFGDMYCRFISNGGAVLETAFPISAVNNTNPGQVTAIGNNFINGDWVFISGVLGAVRYNNRFYSVQVSGSTVTLFDVNGIAVNTTSFGAYTSGGSIARVYKIPSPYAAADLAGIKYVQSASVITLTHPSYPPYNLTAAAPTNWSFTAITFGTTLTPPTGLAKSATSGSGAFFSYAVTAVDAGGQESQQATLAVDNVVNLTTTSGTITLTWNAEIGADHYNVYRAQLSVAGTVPSGQAYGFLGSSTSTTFIDSNIVPDFSQSPPISFNPFSSQNPITFCYFQQRASYAGSPANPLTFWMSQPGAFTNFDYSNPTQEDDSIEGTIVSLKLNAIEWQVPMPGGLILGTAQGAWQVNGGSPGAGATTAITPINATATPQAYNGSTSLQPLVVNYDILYAQPNAIRDLNYNIYANIYTGTDISVLSNHLLLGYTITEWAYAEEPYKVIWGIRDDGQLLSLTFVKEQEIYGWGHHDTNGLFRSVASVREGNTDAVYVVVQRQIGGAWVKMIERFDNRNFTYSNANPNNLPYYPIPMIRANAESAWCVDCGEQSTLGLRSATLYADSIQGPVNFLADANVFTSADVGSVLRMNGGIATISGFTSPTQIGGTWSAVPSNVIQDGGTQPTPAVAGSWSLTAPFTTFSGLDYLEGQLVSILADGGVVTPQVVVNGSVTLANPATLVTAGLGFQAQLQTMPLDAGAGETIQGKRKKIAALTVRGVATRGLKAGSTFATLKAIKELNKQVTLGNPIPLITGDERIVMDPNWTVPGQICLQQDDPLPATILGVIPEIVVGDT